MTHLQTKLHQLLTGSFSVFVCTDIHEPIRNTICSA